MPTLSTLCECLSTVHVTTQHFSGDHPERHRRPIWERLHFWVHVGQSCIPQAGLRLAQADKRGLAMVDSRSAWKAGATLVSGLCRRTLPQRGQRTAHQQGAWTEHNSRASCTLSVLEVGPSALDVGTRGSPAFAPPSTPG